MAAATTAARFETQFSWVQPSLISVVLTVTQLHLQERGELDRPVAYKNKDESGQKEEVVQICPIIYLMMVYLLGNGHWRKFH